MAPEKSKYPLRLYNTMTRQVEPFRPRLKDSVKMFTCGPSIYNSAHIGNYRTFLYEDILHRYLQYLGYTVNRLINFTDVEDKAIKRATEESTSLPELTEVAADDFYRAAGLLHIKLPDFIPRSSTSIDQAVQLINSLLQKGYAYRYKDNVFYDPLKFKGFGRLSRLDMTNWPRKRHRYWQDTYPGNRWNRGDFILWHAYREKRDGPVFWETLLGKGRPAWNIQDPAMITKHLGYEVDISCGGVDNLYRHHDYTIAVIEAISGAEFSLFWLHGEHVLLDTKKMSKSRGNILYPSTLFDRGFSGTSLRYYLIRKHYRSKLNLTLQSLAETDARCTKLRKLAGELIATPGSGQDTAAPETDKYIGRLPEDFCRHMSNDLQVNRACETVEENLEKLVRLKKRMLFGTEQQTRLRSELLAIDSVLQVLFP
jgi:cysteinyl-tRNA synthetase